MALHCAGSQSQFAPVHPVMLPLALPIWHDCVAAHQPQGVMAAQLLHVVRAAQGLAVGAGVGACVMWHCDVTHAQFAPLHPV